MVDRFSVLFTPGGGPGIPALMRAWSESRRVRSRLVLADSDPVSGNLFLPGVDAAYCIPPCLSEDFVPALCRLIEKEKIDYWYTGLDEELPIVAANREIFEELGCRILLPSQENIEKALDKRATHEALDGKISLPDTIYLDDDFDVDDFYEKSNGKVLIKVNSSRGGRHIYIPDDVEEFKVQISRVKNIAQSENIGFMIQRFVKGMEYNTTMLHDKKGSPVYAVSRRKIEKRLVKSTTTAAVIEKRDDVIRQALKAVDELGLYPGFNNVECIVSEEDDEPYFIEINGGRTAAQDMNIVASGINVADLMLEVLEKGTAKHVEHPLDGLGILKIRSDVVVYLSDIEKIPSI